MHLHMSWTRIFWWFDKSQHTLGTYATGLPSPSSSFSCNWHDLSTCSLFYSSCSLPSLLSISLPISPALSTTSPFLQVPQSWLCLVCFLFSLLWTIPNASGYFVSGYLTHNKNLTPMRVAILVVSLLFLHPV